MSIIIKIDAIVRDFFSNLIIPLYVGSLKKLLNNRIYQITKQTKNRSLRRPISKKSPPKSGHTKKIYNFYRKKIIIHLLSLMFSRFHAAFRRSITLLDFFEFFLGRRGCRRGRNCTNAGRFFTFFLFFTFFFGFSISFL